MEKATRKYLEKEKVNLLECFDKGRMDEIITSVYIDVADGEMTSDVGECFLFPADLKLFDACRKVVLKLLKEKSLGAYKCFKSHLKDDFKPSSFEEMMEWTKGKKNRFLVVKTKDAFNLLNEDDMLSLKNYEHVVKINDNIFAFVNDSGSVVEVMATEAVKISS